MRYRLTIAALLLGMAAAATAHADVRLAYVDIQRALNECRAGKQARTQFRGRIERLSAQLEGEQKEAEQLKRELQQKGALMQPDQRQNLEDDYDRKARQFQDDYKNSRDDLSKKDRELTGAIVQDLAVVVMRISAKAGYTLVMERSTLLWASPGMDITDQVIRAYDAMNVKPGSLGEEAARSAGNFSPASAPAPGPEAAPASGPEDEPEPSTGGRSTILK